MNFKDKKIVRLILLWLYCENREVFLEKFWTKFQLGKNSYEVTENFIRIYLEHKDEDHIVVNDIPLYPNFFVFRYLNEITDKSYGYDDGERVFGSEFHYPYKLSRVKHNPLHLKKELSKSHCPFSFFEYSQVIVEKTLAATISLILFKMTSMRC